MLSNTEKQSHSFAIRLSTGKYMETDNAAELATWFERNKTVSRKKKPSVDKTELQKAAAGTKQTGAFVIESERAVENVSGN